MPKRIPGVMEKYTFSLDEEIAAYTFNDLQLAHLQTELAVAMQAKLSINAEELPNKNQFVRAHEYYRGRIEILELLIAHHDDITSKHTALRKQEAIDQTNLSNR